MKPCRNLLIGLYCLFSYSATCQSNLPNGKFLQDSVRIGQTVPFAFSYRHPPEATVFFPDTSYNFAPFELVGEEIFPTSTDERGSLDSVVYLLKTFVVKPRLVLSLPVYLVAESDSSVFSSIQDTIKIVEMITEDELKRRVLRADFSIVETGKPIDYWKYLKYALLTFLIAVGIYLFFGNYLYRQYQLLRYRKRHRDFTVKFKRFIKDSDTSQNVNQALILWKTYLQTLEDFPFTTLTTKEIVEAIPNERLGEALRTMDMNIYGDVQSSQMIFAMSKLLDIANERYEENRQRYEAQLKENRNR